MNDEQKAWRLWHLMQEVSDALWERNEQAFMEFCTQGNKQAGYTKRVPVETNDDLPF